MINEIRQATDSARPRVLLVTASVGTGHNQAARALEEELCVRDIADDSHASGYEVVVDAG